MMDNLGEYMEDKRIKDANPLLNLTNTKNNLAAIYICDSIKKLEYENKEVTIKNVLRQLTLTPFDLSPISDEENDQLFVNAINYYIEYENLTMLQKNELKEYRSKIQQERKEAQSESEYIGSVDDVIEKEVTCIFHITFPSSGYGESKLYNMLDENNDVINYFTSGLFHADVGEKFIIKGRIKKHQLYKEIKQTVIQRARKIKLNE